jgi:hypothetical protein
MDSFFFLSHYLYEYISNRTECCYAVKWPIVTTTCRPDMGITASMDTVSTLIIQKV